MTRQRLQRFFRLPEATLSILLMSCVGYAGMLGYGVIRQHLDGSPEFDRDRAWAHAVDQMDFGPRTTGSLASRQFRFWLKEHLTLAGWRVFEHPFPAGDGVQGHNVIAYKGTGPEILLGAHYDSRLWADEDPEPRHRERPVPGANDGASGVAVLMELARVLDVAGSGHTVCLAFFDAEDNGYIPGWQWIMGSQAFARALPQHPACNEPQAVVIVDMIGDQAQNIHIEQTGDAALARIIWDQAAALGYAMWFIPEPRHYLIDDHTPFLQKGIPAITVIDFDYPYWHTTADTLDKISPDSLYRVGHVMETWLEAGASLPR